MNRNEVIDTLKSKLLSIFKFAESGYTFQTKEGIVITSSSQELGVDSEVYQLTESGEQTPIEDGDYTLENGQGITVSNGVITSVKAVENVDEAESEPSEELATDDAVEEEPAVETIEEPQDESDNVSTRIDALEETQKEILSMLETILNGNVEMKSQIEKFSKEPADEPVVSNRKTKLSNYKSGFESDLDEIRKIAKGKK